MTQIIQEPCGCTRGTLPDGRPDEARCRAHRRPEDKPLTRQQKQALSIARETPGVTAWEISERIHCRPHFALGALWRLEQRGMIGRVRSTDGGEYQDRWSVR
jgi:DNA-binding MarR family transcriptional regulator